MANTVIRLKKSSVSAHLPSNTQLDFGEIALNYADGKIFYKDPSNNIQQISGSANTFYTINANSTLLVSTSPTDILTINPGDNIEITGNFLTDTITIAANIKSVFDQANAAYARANSSNDVLYIASAFDIANAGYNKANAANVLAYNTGISANNYAGVMANAANAYANTLTPNLSPVFVVANAAFNTANAGYTSVNAAYTVANAAYNKANNISVNIGSAPPVGSIAGNLWWDTVSGRLFIYYTDIDSSQWVETSPSGGTVDYVALASNVATVLTGNANTETATVSYVIDSFSANTYRTAKYIIQGVSFSNVHSTEVLLTHNGANVFITEYATIFTGNSELYTVSANLYSSNVNLIINSANANTVVDFYRFKLAAR